MPKGDDESGGTKRAQCPVCMKELPRGKGNTVVQGDKDRMAKAAMNPDSDDSPNFRIVCKGCDDTDPGDDLQLARFMNKGNGDF